MNTRWIKAAWKGKLRFIIKYYKKHLPNRYVLVYYPSQSRVDNEDLL